MCTYSELLSSRRARAWSCTRPFTFTDGWSPARRASAAAAAAGSRAAAAAAGSCASASAATETPELRDAPGTDSARCAHAAAACASPRRRALAEARRHAGVRARRQARRRARRERALRRFKRDAFLGGFPSGFGNVRRARRAIRGARDGVAGAGAPGVAPREHAHGAFPGAAPGRQRGAVLHQVQLRLAGAAQRGHRAPQRGAREGGIRPALASGGGDEQLGDVGEEPRVEVFGARRRDGRGVRLDDGDKQVVHLRARPGPRAATHRRASAAQSPGGAATRSDTALQRRRAPATPRPLRRRVPRRFPRLPSRAARVWPPSARFASGHRSNSAASSSTRRTWRVHASRNAASCGALVATNPDPAFDPFDPFDPRVGSVPRSCPPSKKPSFDLSPRRDARPPKSSRSRS